MTGPLRTEDEIRAAGAEAVRGWQLTDAQIDRVVAADLLAVPGRSIRIPIPRAGP